MVIESIQFEAPYFQSFSLFRGKLVDFLDLRLLKDMVYLNIVLGLTFALFADHFFFVLQPMYLYDLKISKVIHEINLFHILKMLMKFVNNIK